MALVEGPKPDITKCNYYSATIITEGVVMITYQIYDFSRHFKSQTVLRNIFCTNAEGIQMFLKNKNFLFSLNKVGKYYS